MTPTPSQPTPESSGNTHNSPQESMAIPERPTPTEPKRSYVSGGLNPNSTPTCGTCGHLYKGSHRGDGGWCPIHGNVSVSSTGGCDRHTSLPQTEPKREAVAGLDIELNYFAEAMFEAGMSSGAKVSDTYSRSDACKADAETIRRNIHSLVSTALSAQQSELEQVKAELAAVRELLADIKENYIGTVHDVDQDKRLCRRIDALLKWQTLTNRRKHG